ncbi:DUF7286 family protein [Halomarina oriensis]|uniref:Uncharacterized protein n=1 Tax=Halomarina oriensis TaxID=671145 RepID=A0A6B0GL01_9EURY|nr:hypothetical protein [Halomarina oriensis]MWG35424.1 hypothetical protein [Halomarina oriensis]
MRLADDTRGRVPFALLGVLLLVTSATVATTQLTGTSDPTEPAVDRAMREATATTQTVLRTAVTDAARRAARDPITQPANTPYGDVLNESEPFEDALRVRIYLLVRERLGAVSASTGDVRARASLPAVDSPADLRAAKRRVHLSRAGPNGTALRVRIEGISVRAVDGERTIGEKRIAPTLTVAVPALELHDRAERFERRLDAGLTEPGFERRFTAGMYALAWVRGAAQYQGAPVANVVGTDHVALAANDAALGVQRETFGTTDPEAAHESRLAWGNALATDLTPGSIPGPLVDETLERGERGLRRLDDPREETTTVSPDVAADAALTAAAGETLDAVGRRTYAVDARVVSAVSPPETTVDRDARPDGNWTRVGATTRTDRSVGRGDDVDAPAASAPAGWTAFERAERRVTVRTVTTTRWRRGDRTETTTTVRVETYRVGLAVVGRHSPESRVARRGVAGVYERAGVRGGPNLRGVPARATDRLVVDRGGHDALARRAVAGDIDTSSRRLTGERPAELREWLRADLARLDREVRTVSVTLSQADVGTYAVSPPARLAARIRAKRATLLDAPATYDGVAGKARVAARRAYLDAVLAELDTRAAAHRERRATLNETLGEHDSSLGRVQESLDAAASGEGSSETAEARGPLAVTVDTAPTYLDVTPRPRADFGDGPGEVTPLDTRNVNWVTVPYGDTGGWVSRLVAGPERVSLRAAAGTLRAGRHRPDGSPRSDADREALRGEVRDSVAFVRDRLAGELRAEGACETTTDCRGVVDAGLGHWQTPADRALALANGSAAERVAATAADAESERRRLAAVLRTTAREALVEDAARPPQSAVRGVSDANRAALQRGIEEVATRTGEEAVDRTTQRYLNRTLDDVPMGIPVAPVPGYWYATLNGWSVSVEGTYERLTVRSRRAARDTVYVRDGSSVGLDVDDDGESERLGNAPKLSFEASTTVVVVVPPGRRGVADADGQQSESSPGYE